MLERKRQESRLREHEDRTQEELGTVALADSGRPHSTGTERTCTK